jgi:hypothetical protein
MRRNTQKAARWAAVSLFGMALFAPGLAPGADAQAARFLSGAEDVPLMPALTETDEPVVFESPMGVLVRSEAKGEASPATVRAFYLETLPALGWRPAGGDLQFVRDSQRLTLAVRGPDGAGGVAVTFTLVDTAPPALADGDPQPEPNRSP